MQPVEADRCLGGSAITRDSETDDLSDRLLERSLDDLFDRIGRDWGIPNPTDVLRECVEKKEWFKGIVLSATFLEGIGSRVLSLHFARQIREEKIERLQLNLIIVLLYASRIIDHSTYSKMVEINQYRNDIVHTKEPFSEPEPRAKDAKRIIEMAITCLSKLIYEYDEVLFEKVVERRKKSKKSRHGVLGSRGK